MSLFSELQSATTEAHANLAQLQGMGQDDDGNFLYQGAYGIGVFGRPVLQEDMQPGGGYKQRTVIPLVISRENMTTAPAEKATLTRLFPRIEYRIVTVDKSDPLEWKLELLKVGAP